MTTHIEIYDTTLRDGSQTEGISFSVEDKIQIARKLDALGVDFIEGGWPGSNPKDAEFFERARSLELDHARITAFSSTRKAGVAVEDDPIVQALLDSEAQVVTLVGKSSELHVTDVLGATLEENLDMIADTVAYLKAKGRTVFYDAEHFFDGYKLNPGYTLLTIQAAAKAGADCVILCDTNGGALPEEVRAVVEEAARAVDVSLGIHAHNDSELAVANSLAAVAAGARHVQGTINGIGERAATPTSSRSSPTSTSRWGSTRSATTGSPASRKSQRSSTSAPTAPPTPSSPSSARAPSPTRAGSTPPPWPRSKTATSTSTPPWWAT